MDFLWDEVWWMETIIASVISAVSGLFVALIGAYFFIGKKLDIVDRVEKELEKHDCNLNTCDKGLKYDHQQLLLQQERLLFTGQSIQEKAVANTEGLGKLHDYIIQKNAKQEEKYALLNQNQQRMADAVQQGINGYDSIRQELLRLNAENQQLRQEIAVLQQQAQAHTSQKPTTQEHPPENRPPAFYGDDLER